MNPQLNPQFALQLAKQISSSTEINLRVKELTKRTTFPIGSPMWTTSHARFVGETYDGSYEVYITYNENYYDGGELDYGFRGYYNKKNRKTTIDLSHYKSVDDLIQRLNTIFPNTLITNP